jgi:hypothetical protein
MRTDPWVWKTRSITDVTSTVLAKEEMWFTWRKQCKNVTWASQRNQQWQNINLKWVATLNSAIPLYWIKHQATWIAIEIMLHPGNFSRDWDFNLSWSWYPLTNVVKQY